MFSGLVFVKATPLAWNWYMERGWEGLHVDAKFFADTDFGWWAKIFYVSKFYEVR